MDATSSLLEKRMTAQLDRAQTMAWLSRDRETRDIALRPDSLALNAGYVDGHAGGERIVTLPWSNPKPFLSTGGQEIVDGLRP